MKTLRSCFFAGLKFLRISSYLPKFEYCPMPTAGDTAHMILGTRVGISGNEHELPIIWSLSTLGY